MFTLRAGKGTDRPSQLRPQPPPSVLRWTILCAAAETVGMAAAAAAVTSSRSLVGVPATGWQVTAALALVVAGGLIEGVALGLAQGSGLVAWLPRPRRTVWLLVTVVVAGLGWAAASASSVLRAADGRPPSLWVVIVGALGLGVVMGAVLGAVQSLVLRGQVPRPGRWVVANVCGWAVAMAIIFLGASVPSLDWSAPAVVATGAVTGLVAGTALGIVTGGFLWSLVGGRSTSRGRSL